MLFSVVFSWHKHTITLQKMAIKQDKKRSRALKFANAHLSFMTWWKRQKMSSYILLSWNFLCHFLRISASLPKMLFFLESSLFSFLLSSLLLCLILSIWINSWKKYIVLPRLERTHIIKLMIFSLVVLIEGKH